MNDYYLIKTDVGTLVECGALNGNWTLKVQATKLFYSEGNVKVNIVSSMKSWKISTNMNLVFFLPKEIDTA
jgi:hypothetical protein